MSDNPKLRTPLGRLELMPDAVHFRGITSSCVIPYNDIRAVRIAKLPAQKLSIETDTKPSSLVALFGEPWVAS